MSNEQEEINKLSKLLRMQVVEFLIKKDIVDYKATMPSEEELLYMKREIFNMPCCTKKLKSLFRDAHEMHEDKGMYPHAVTIGDLSWCLKNRSIGYQSTQAVACWWLPYKHDEELRKLPAFSRISSIYKERISNGLKIIAPVKDCERKEPEGMAISLARRISMENAI